MLAAAKARRLAREGYRTLLVCFNQRLAADDHRRPRRCHRRGLLGHDLPSTVRAPRPQAGTLAPDPNPIPQAWWNEALPNALDAAIERRRVRALPRDRRRRGPGLRDRLARDARPAAVEPGDVLWVFHDPGQAVIRDDVVGELGLERVELYENLRNPTSIAELSDRFYVGGESVAAYRGGGGTRYRIETAEPGKPTLEALRRELHRLVEDEQVEP